MHKPARLAFHVVQQAPPGEDARAALIAAALALAGGAALAIGLQQSNTGLMGVGAVAAGLFAFGTVLFTVSWRRALRRGTIVVSVRDVRTPADAGAGFECGMTFDSAAARGGRATLRGWRTHKSRPGSSAQVQSGPDFYRERGELVPVASPGAALVSRFPVVARDELPPTQRTGESRVVWQLEIELNVEGRTHQLLYPLRVESTS